MRTILFCALLAGCGGSPATDGGAPDLQPISTDPCAGITCGRGATCVDGSCSCGAGLALCGVDCVDLLSDVANCLHCGHVCADGADCRSGFCVCPKSQLVCGGACVDPNSDAANCGACGHICQSGIACQAGVCACPAGSEDCGSSACIDTTSDAANCGGCGHSCLGGACTAGLCAPIQVVGSPDAYQPSFVAVDATNLYWANYGSIMKKPLAGGAAVKLTDAYADSFSLDAVAIYYTQWENFDVGWLKSVPIAGGPAATLASGLSHPTSLVSDGTSLYWSTDGNNGGLWRGGLDASNPLLVAPAPFVTSLLVTGSDLWWTEGYGASALVGGQQISLEMNVGEPTGGIALMNNRVYFGKGSVESGGCDVEWRMLDGDGSSLLPNTCVEAIVSDAGGVYFTTYTQGSVMKIPPHGAPYALADGQANPQGIAIDGSWVYFANTKDFTIMKVAK